MKKLMIVVGTRPNFIKVTQFKKVSENEFPGQFEIKIVHTGQHYDQKMADVFFQQFDLLPDFFLNISASSPNGQMAEVMSRLEPLTEEYAPDLMLVTGDVNSTLAAALAANKLDLPLAHIESGLRSCDRSMPEEINRVLTDEISNILFVTEKSGLENLKGEGKEKQVFFVGNTMIDTMVAYEEKIKKSPVMERLKLKSRGFVLMTMHRPATVDHRKEFMKLIHLVEAVTELYPVVFPIHPRTAKRLQQFELYDRVRANDRILLEKPMGYFAFQNLIANCRFILTDSGGIQEEATFRKVPCLTLRPNTERPSTITVGSNTLVPFDLAEVKKQICSIESGGYKKGRIPRKWDGRATYRILNVLQNLEL